LAAGEITLAAGTPSLSPAESQKRFRLPSGFRMELVASEPHLAEPTAMTFDARGRIFVCELHGWNLEGYYDALELNKTLVLDKTVRRIGASKQAQERAARETYGTVKLLEDTDGDGLVDRATVWADRLPPCYGIIAAREGVIVICAPDIIYLADRDGDGKADHRETLFTGFCVGRLESRMNNPRWGLDNWIYVAPGVANADSQRTITGPHLKEKVRLGNTCFRFKPDGSRLEPVSGVSPGFGLAFDDWGDRFLCQNSQHILFATPLPYHYLARNPYVSAPDPVQNICSYGTPAKVYPTSQPDPWRRERGRQAEWVQFYGANEALGGRVTSACGIAVYQADQLPPAYLGSYFFCEPAYNLIHHSLLEPQGIGFSARRAEQNREFLTSTDQWFRPIHLTVGPDGAFYIVDMCREIIEVYDAIPRYLQQQYVRSLVNGRDRGRIWRLGYGEGVAGRQSNLARASADELEAELASPNAWRRLTAQRLLVERGDKAVVPGLIKLVRTGPTPQSRLHALYTLAGLSALEPDSLGQALDDPHYGIRWHALQLAEPWLDKKADLLAKALSLVEDPHPKVRLQLAFTLGESQDAKALTALAQLAAREGDNAWMRAAVLSTVTDRAGRLAEILLRRPEPMKADSLILPTLAAVVGTRHHDEELAQLLKSIAAMTGTNATPAKGELLKGLVQGLERGQAKELRSKDGRQALEKLLASPSAEIRQQALYVAGMLQVPDSPALRDVRGAVRKILLDPKQPLPARLNAVKLLTARPIAELVPFGELLSPQQPLQLQLAVVRMFAASSSERGAALLIEHWAGSSPLVQKAILDALLGRQDWLPEVLDALEKKEILPGSITGLQRAQLLDHPRADLRRRAQSLFAGSGGQGLRKEVLERYAAALTLPRHVEHGKLVFEQHCGKCHQLNGRGTAVGPDLAAVKNRPDASILGDILDPNNSITPGYTSYSVVTRSGKIFNGLLAAETATSITLRREQGAADTILRRDIEDMKVLSTSLMPEGLEKEMKPQDVADLLGYLREELKSVAPPRRILFEDDSAFLDALTLGRASAKLVTEEHYSGQASLRLAPGERSSPQIPGWSFRIAEKPGPGEYRFLRLAWKLPEGKGVLIELAKEGQWSAAFTPRFRFFSGVNTTSGAGTEISPTTPRSWTVVTIDLWKYCRAFTLTGIGLAAMGGPAYFDRIEVLQSLEDSITEDMNEKGGVERRKN
jgi:putative membrane-bound dehydrogenase-like protein